MEQLIFCNATLRPSCILATNLCCLVCEKREECRLQCGKVKPCEPSDEEFEEKCAYLI